MQSLQRKDHCRVAVLNILARQVLKTLWYIILDTVLYTMYMKCKNNVNKSLPFALEAQMVALESRAVHGFGKPCFYSGKDWRNSENMSSRKPGHDFSSIRRPFPVLTGPIARGPFQYQPRTPEVFNFVFNSFYGKYFSILLISIIIYLTFKRIN